MLKLLKSYFNWTYPRGSLHYDVMVTAILLFIFITPHLWNYGDHPAKALASTAPIQVVTNGDHGLIVTVQATDVPVEAAASARDVKKALRRAIEPVTGDAVWIERWEYTREAQGKPAVWTVWAHR